MCFIYSRIVYILLIILFSIAVFLCMRVKEHFQQKDPILIEIRNQLIKAEIVKMPFI